MRKHRVTNTLGLAAVPLTPSKTAEGYETRAEFYAREEREREAAATAEKAAAEQSQHDAELAKNASRAAHRQIQVADLMTEPSDILAARCPQSPMTAKNPTEYSEQMLAAIRQGLSGITFTDEGKNKLMAVAGLNRMHINLTDARVWTILFDHMVSLGIFEANGSLAKPKPVIEPAPAAIPSPVTEPKPTLDDILDANSIESRSGNVTIKNAVALSAYGEWETAFNEFVMDCRTLFKEAFTQDENDSLGKLILARNLNPKLQKSWHEARRLGVRAGYLSGKFLTADESLAWQMDRGLVPPNTFEQRQAFNRRVSSIHKGIPVLG